MRDNLRFDVTLAPDEPFYITPVFDVHLDSRECDREGFRKMLDARAALPNHRFFGGGDLCNLVMPRDLKRHRPSVPAPGYGERDDYINALIEDTMQFITRGGARWDWIGLGNHEDEAIKRHSVDVVRILCDKAGVEYGSYSGWARYVIGRRTNPKNKISFTLLYHHGAWGGVVIKGMGGAWRWASRYNPWNVFCFGHGHQSASVWEPCITRNQQDGVHVYNQCVVQCGTWAKSYNRNGEPPDYAERAGMPPTIIASPLIKVW